MPMIPNCHVIVLFDVVWPWCRLDESLGSFINKIIDGQNQISEFGVNLGAEFEEPGFRNSRDKHMTGLFPGKGKEGEQENDEDISHWGY